ncbi:hypothetical protein lerEdw1_004193 [Lerista edwardsae]|nr:hypothetical protein lerEdw1_004193 [Lerista edwardsae]
MTCGKVSQYTNSTNVLGSCAGRKSKMKLWDVVAVCVVLLNTISTFPLPAGKTPSERGRSVREGTEDDHTSSRLPTPYAGQMDCKKKVPFPHCLTCLTC